MDHSFENDNGSKDGIKLSQFGWRKKEVLRRPPFSLEREGQGLDNLCRGEQGPKWSLQGH